MPDFYPLFSIIIATYNAGNTLQSCLDSVFGQTYSQWEVVIFDGGSTDGTINVLEINSQFLHYWKTESDNGIYDAWNKALKHITGDWVYFLGADDVLANEHVLNNVANFIRGLNDNCNLICAPVIMHGKKKDYLIQPDISMFPNKMVPHQGVFHKRILFQHDRFSDQFRIRGDYEFLLRLWNKGELRVCKMAQPIARCAYGGLSSSGRIRLVTFKETLFIRRKYNLNPYSLNMLMFGIRSLAKVILSFFDF